MAQIGFIGLGHMGLPMAKNLLKAGHDVIGFDRATAPMRALTEAGGRVAANLKQVAEKQDIVICMLQTGEQVKSVCLGEQGVFHVMRPGTLLIDCSTIDVETSRRVHHEAEQVKLFMVDAPVSGGVAGAEQAKLTFMVGGETPAFQRARPILEVMGATLVHAGGAGSGGAAKICNNMILGVSMIAVSEAFLLADKLGLSPQKLHEIVTQASGDCWVMEHYVPVPDVLPNVPANQAYEAGFTGDMMLKDLRLAEAVAKDENLVLQMGALARALYEKADDTQGAQDFSSIISRLI